MWPMGLFFSYKASQGYQAKLAQASLFRDTAVEGEQCGPLTSLIFFSVK